MRTGWRGGESTPVLVFNFLLLALESLGRWPAWEMHGRSTVNEKSSLLCFSPPPFRWWVLWSQTPLHGALSCTTSSSRSLLLWRTTSTSAAARPEPAGVFLCFSHQSSLSLADSCLFPNKSYLGRMPTEAKAFPKVSLLLRRREKWKGKGLNPLKHHLLFSFFFCWSQNAKEWS